MGRADAALELLLTEDGARAEEVARELDLLNRDRREAETRILFEADAACSPQASQAAMVVAGEGWHPGVVGIVASRLVEKWRRPAVVIALDGDDGRGSGRSISAYDLHAGLAACEAHLRRFGGHRMAAGVELEAGAVEGFRERAGRPCRRSARSRRPDRCRASGRRRAGRRAGPRPGGAAGAAAPVRDRQPAAHPAGAGRPPGERDRDGRGAPARPLHARHRCLAGPRGGLRRHPALAGPRAHRGTRRGRAARAQPLERHRGAARGPACAVPPAPGRAAGARRRRAVLGAGAPGVRHRPIPA